MNNLDQLIEELKILINIKSFKHVFQESKNLNEKRFCKKSLTINDNLN